MRRRSHIAPVVYRLVASVPTMKDQTAAAIRLLEAELGPVIVDGAGDHPQLCIQCGAITYDVNREGHAQHRNGCPPARRRRAVQ